MGVYPKATNSCLAIATHWPILLANFYRYSIKFHYNFPISSFMLYIEYALSSLLNFSLTPISHILHALPPLLTFYLMSILHILHTLPAVLVFKLRVWHYHITHITCINPSAEFSLKSILYILHALPTLQIFSHKVNITHITCITWCACF